MSYDQCAEKVQDILQEMTTTFVAGTSGTGTTTADQVTLGDYRILDKGITRAAVLVPGDFDSGEAHAYQTLKRWDILLDIFQKHTTKREETVANFTAMRDAIIAKLDLAPSLRNTTGVSGVRITGDGDPVEILNAQKQAVFISQRLRIVVTQRVTLTGGEYV